MFAMATTPAELRFTEATPSDIPAISEFFWAMWNEAGPDAPGFSGATENVIAEIAQPDAIAVRIGGPNRRMFLAYKDESVVGFVATRSIDTATIEMAGIVVLQSMVGQGIGSPLVAISVTSAREQGFRRMIVSTEVDNQRAIDFYRGRGFATTGESTTVVEDIEVSLVNLVLEL